MIVMSVQMIPAYVLHVPNWVQPAMRTITIHATREGVETPDYKVCRIYSNVDINEMVVDMPLRDGVEVSMSFLAEAVDGPRAFMLFDSQPDRYGAVRLINIDSDLDININLAGVAEDTRGHGILSGSFPLSLLTDNNQLPNQAQIRILYRPNTGDAGDGTLVATTTCNTDGTWQVSGLNESLKFDIVARIPGFNDVIISDVQPTELFPNP